MLSSLGQTCGSSVHTHGQPLHMKTTIVQAANTGGGGSWSITQVCKGWGGSRGSVQKLTRSTRATPPTQNQHPTIHDWEQHLPRHNQPTWVRVCIIKGQRLLAAHSLQQMQLPFLPLLLALQLASAPVACRTTTQGAKRHKHPRQERVVEMVHLWTTAHAPCCSNGCSLRQGALPIAVCHAYPSARPHQPAPLVCCCQRRLPSLQSTWPLLVLLVVIALAI